MSDNERQIEALRSLGALISFARLRIMANGDPEFMKAGGFDRPLKDGEVVKAVRAARADLLNTGFNVPDHWLTVRVVQASNGGVEQLDRVGHEIAAAILRLEVSPASSDDKPKTSQQRPAKQTKRRAGAPRKLTDKQNLALTLYVRHEGRINDVAAAMGVKHPTVIQHLNAAKKKIPQLAEQMKKQHTGKRQSLPTDRRGQVNL